MYQILFYVGLICFVIFFVLSVYFFFHNHVKKLMGDVTGHNARHSIAEIRKRHAAKLADFDMTADTDVLEVKNETMMTSFGDDTETTVLPHGDETETDVLSPVETAYTDVLETVDEETELLTDYEETELLIKHEDIERLTDHGETDILTEGQYTTPLRQPGHSGAFEDSEHVTLGESILGQSVQPMPDIFQVEEDAVVVHR